MLTRNLVESELSISHLHAIAAIEGFAVDIPRIDNDSIDAVISASGLIDPTSIRHSPRIEVQLKSTVNPTIINGGTHISYPLSIKNYDDLRVDTAIPRLLVLLTLPQNRANWLNHQPPSLILQECCYFINLNGLPPSPNASTQNVHIPIVNILSPTTLKDLMIKASKLLPL